MNKNNRKLLVSILLSGLIVISLPFSMLTLAFSLPDQYDNTFYGEMKDKLNLIRDSEGKRIIFIGGSSVPFSLNGELIRKELPDYTPVDFGLYASLGTEAMMYLADEYIREDDIVILAPEQSSQTLSMYFDGQEMLKALDGNLSYMSKLRREDREAMLASIPFFDADKLSYLISGNTPDPKDIYRHDSFNEYGDIKVNRENNTMLDGVDLSHMISLQDDVIDSDFIDEMNSFCSSWTKKGAQLYYHFSPMNEAALEDKSQLDSYYDFLNQQLSFDILGNPHDSVMEKEWFYDTNYHLNTSGSIKFTKQMIKDIKLVLNDTSRTDIDDPEMPELPESETGIGDDSDLSCFNYEKVNGTYQLTSLTEEGKKRKSLIIPYDVDSIRITSFSDTLFQNDTVIKEITLQDNIRTIYDYSFSGCSNLKKINIDNSNPSSVSVGSYLLDGCDAQIYVPEEALSSYKVNYFWSGYAGHIFTMEE